MRKMVIWKLCKRLKFNHTDKWYRHYQEIVLENETYKILLDIEIKTGHPTRTRRFDLILIEESPNPIEKTWFSCNKKKRNEYIRWWTLLFLQITELK